MSGDLHLLPPSGNRARALALVILTTAPFIFGFLVVALGQDANWDLRNYHWYNAYAFLTHRYSLDLLPSQTPWFYNPTLDVPFYILATHTPAMVAGFTLGFVQGLNFLLLFMLAYVSLIIPNPRQKVLVCAGLATLGMLGGGGIALLGTTFYDNVTSLGLFLSALLVIRNFDQLMTAPWPRAVTLAILFGIPAGLMMGLKLPCVVFCTGLCVALLLTGGRFGRRLLTALAFGLGILLGMMVTLGHWAWFLEAHFDSPLFPYFNGFFKSPLAPFTSARDIEFIPHSIKDYVLFPFIFSSSPFRVGEIPWRDWRLPILYILLPAALIICLVFGRNRNRQDGVARSYASRYLLWVGVLSYGMWLVMFCVYRYAVPLEMLVPLLIVFAVGLLPLKGRTRALVTSFILLIVAASVQPGNWYRRTSWLDHYVEARIPSLGDTTKLMVLMAGFEPYSHLITQFPPEIPFVRVESNFASPGEDKGINTLIRARVDAHKGRFLLLIPPWQHQLAEEALQHFHLSPAWKTCQTVTDRLYDDKTMDLCNVDRE